MGCDGMQNLNINFNLYKSFYYVAKYDGFTKASYHASISQSSLSSNIKKLEEELGTVLFNRKGAKVELTQTGRELYSKLEDILIILNSDTYNKKEIKIGCLRFIADNYLEDSITTFYKNNSDVKLNIEILDSANLFQWLKKDQLDLAISRYPLFYKFEKNIVIDKIFDAENVFVCSYEYYQQEMNKMDNEEYIYSLILPTSSEKRRTIEQYLVDNNIKYKVVIELPNSNLLKSLTGDNMGIAYINKTFVQDEINSGKFVVLDRFKNLPIDNICLLYNSKKIDTTTKKYIDSIKQSIKKTDS